MGVALARRIAATGCRETRHGARKDPGVWIEAVLTVDDLQRVLRDFAPASIRLGENGELVLAEPSLVVLIPELGLRVVCAATLRWPLLGVSVPVAMRSVDVMICPIIERLVDREALVFKLHIEHIDVSLFPAFVDDKITARVNEELAKHHVEFSWQFPKTLSYVFQLPDALLSTSALSLEVVAGTLRVTDTSLAFAVSYRTQFQRRPPAAAG
jgi:hypothetical protein